MIAVGDSTGIQVGTGIMVRYLLLSLIYSPKNLSTVGAPMNIREKTRSGYVHQEIGAREEIDFLRRQLRRAAERSLAAFDQGFSAATRLAEAGATPERLREASGTVAIQWADTEPCYVDEEPTLVDVRI